LSSSGVGLWRLAPFLPCTGYAAWFTTILSNIRFRPQPQSPLATDAAPSTHPSKLTLPTIWILELAAWFALAEAKFRTSNITSQRVMFDLLVAALPEKNLSQVMDIIKNIPAINPFEVLKLRLLEAQVLSDQEKMDALFQLGPLASHPSHWPLCCQSALPGWSYSRFSSTSSCSDFPRRLGCSSANRSAATSVPWRRWRTGFGPPTNPSPTR
jgi:hypothetical protein